MSTIAINARHPEEIRVTTFKEQKISNLYIENSLKKSALKDIYAGVIRSIEPSLAAVFVEYGPNRHGFLQVRDIAPEYLSSQDPNHLKTSLKIGQSIIVQIKKDERRDKGAALTTYITLPGTYLVLMPNHRSSGGVSKQIGPELRKEMQNLVEQLQPPENMSVILRTAGAGRSINDLNIDLNLLLKEWDAIQSAFKSRKAPFLIFQEGDIFARTVRDYVREDVTEIIVDDFKALSKIKDYASRINPSLVEKLRLYQEKKPLFLNLGIEDEVESAFQRVIRLPSGGSLIFDRAEALIAVDVNSGSSTKHGDIAETALKTNLEAAAMIAEQLCLRDLGGLIVIDFIGMKEEAHKRAVETKLLESTANDRARIQIGNIISRFDVLVMSRQRLRSSLGRVNEDICSCCEGIGTQRSIESLALSIIRAIEKKLLFKKHTTQIRIEASVELVTYLGNEKRATLYELEQEHRLQLLLLPNTHWNAGRYKITMNESSGEESSAEAAQSYTLISEASNEAVMPSLPRRDEIPAVERFKSTVVQQSLSPGRLIKGLINKLTGWGESIHDKTSEKTSPMTRAEGKPHISLKTKKPLRPSMAQKFNKETKKPTSRQEALSDTLEQRTTRSPRTKVVSASKSQGEAPLKEKGMYKTQPLASPPPFKRGVVNRYGGDPSLQRRGY